jgi:hypothetical protein
VDIDQLELDRDKEVDLSGKRLLIFVVAYNAETTIEKVLARIPATLHQPGVADRDPAAPDGGGQDREGEPEGDQHEPVGQPVLGEMAGGSCSHGLLPDRTTLAWAPDPTD